MVPRAGLEPARVASLPPQDSVSTISTTSARIPFITVSYMDNKRIVHIVLPVEFSALLGTQRALSIVGLLVARLFLLILCLLTLLSLWLLLCRNYPHGQFVDLANVDLGNIGRCRSLRRLCAFLRCLLDS